MVSQLFQAAESGDLEAVRQCLKESSSVDIEIKDHTGMTPLIVAVRGGFVEVVKELLTAGADPHNPSSHGPPSIYTGDQQLLDLLAGASQQHHQHPHHPYPLAGAMYMDAAPPLPPPHPHGYHSYYPQPFVPYGYMPMPHQAGHLESQAQLAGPPDVAQPLQPENGGGTIPPYDVSKNIPCKFFPTCRYGSKCAFQHPTQPAQMAATGPMQPAYPPFDHRPPFQTPFYHMAPPFGYPQPPMHPMSPPAPVQGYPFHQSHTSHDYPTDPAFIVVPPAFPPTVNFLPSAHATPFSPSTPPPAVAPCSIGAAVPVEASEGPTDQVPTVLPSSDPAIVSMSDPRPASAPVAAQLPRRQSLGTEESNGPLSHPQHRQHRDAHSGGGFPRKSVGGSGGSRKLGGPKGPPSSRSWLNGSPPSCIFFQRGLCRNGNMCRFPHMRDGVDCRLPGVIDGTVAAAPISIIPKIGRPPLSATFDFRSVAETIESRDVAQGALQREAVGSPGPAGSLSVKQEFVSSTPSVFIPSKQGATGPRAGFVRSQPPTRPPSPNSLRGPRSLSANASGRPHVGAGDIARPRVPTDEDFPSLSGSLRDSTHSLGASVVVLNGKTAAQVLATPAPQVVQKAPAAKPTQEEGQNQASSGTSEGSSAPVSQSSSDLSEEDAVLVAAARGAPSAPNGAPSTISDKPTSRIVPAISFASAAGALVGARA